jgi:phenylpropionate dioxygenase-like ring-hydroxylating dioxygenase large terminal subunit
VIAGGRVVLARVWQMACRLEEIPSRGDFVEYEILDQSVIVVRLDEDNVRAFYNSCRHRGMKIVEGSGSRRSFVCPFHGWCWGLDGANTFVLRPEVFDEGNLGIDDLALVPVKCELWGGCTWINLDDSAPPLRECEHAQVLDEQDRVIDGLYATGNTTATVMGRTYPGAGASIASTMVFGYVAARHAATRELSQTQTVGP